MPDILIFIVTYLFSFKRLFASPWNAHRIERSFLSMPGFGLKNYYCCFTVQNIQQTSSYKLEKSYGIIPPLPIDGMTLKPKRQTSTYYSTQSSAIATSTMRNSWMTGLDNFIGIGTTHKKNALFYYTARTAVSSITRVRFIPT